jgi:hypothetical protein
VKVCILSVKTIYSIFMGQLSSSIMYHLPLAYFAESNVYSNQRVGSLNVHDMPIQPVAFALFVDSSGKRYSEYIAPSLQCAISQF